MQARGPRVFEMHAFGEAPLPQIHPQPIAALVVPTTAVKRA